MTNKELAIHLIKLLKVKDGQDMVLIDAVIKLLGETDPEQTHPKAEPVKAKKEPAKKTASKKKDIDWGKGKACFNAGWDLAKIADELGCSVQGVKYHFQKEGLLK